MQGVMLVVALFVGATNSFYPVRSNNTEEEIDGFRKLTRLVVSVETFAVVSGCKIRSMSGAILEDCKHN